MITRKAIITTVASVLTIGAVSGAVALNSSPQKAKADDSPIVQTLADQSKELANHEARITNTENNVQAVASKTGTSTTTVVQVPAVESAQTEAVASSPTSTPVTVTSFEQIPVDSNGSMDCKLTYSDGTTYQWHWKIVAGNTTRTSDICSNMQIGQVKKN